MTITNKSMNKKSKRGLTLLGILALTALFTDVNLTIINESHYNNNLNDENDIDIIEDNIIEGIRSAAGIDPIYVNGNWSDMAATYDYITGTGTAWDPYTISNVEIDAQGKGFYGMYIENTNDYFVIKNCIINNANGGASGAGIRIWQANNGRIENCTIYDSYATIELYIANNTEIVDNDIYDNFMGITIQQSSWAFIEQNDIQNSGIGITISQNSDYSIIYNNTISNNANDGIFFQQNSNGNISLNTLYNNSNYGIFVDQCDQNDIEDNTIIGGQWGILLEAGASSCDYNNIIKNNITDSSITGITLSGNAQNNTIEGNTIDNSPKGISISQGDYNDIIDNTITNCTVGIEMTGMTLYNTIEENTITNSNGMGIYLWNNAQWNTIENNDISNLGYEGIKLQSTCNYNDIIGNTIFNTSKGIYVYDSANTDIFYNTILNSSSEGIHLDSAQNTEVEHNTIANGSADGILIERNLFSGTDDNIIVRFNEIETNAGIGLKSCPWGQTTGNQYYFNNFISNGITPQAEDHVMWSNYFYLSTGQHGNYWSDHSGMDDNVDGVYENSYIIFGRPDNFPLVYRWEYYQFSNMTVDPAYNPSTLGWNVTRFANITKAVQKVNNISFWYPPSDQIFINVKNGTYYPENGGLILKRPNTAIIGESAKGVKINGDFSTHVIELQTGNILLENLTIQYSGSSGVYSNVMSSNIFIVDCIIQGNGHGIELRNCWDVIIHNNKIYNNTQNGIDIFDNMWMTRNITISNNEINTCGGNGINLNGTGEIQNFYIEENVIDNNGKLGINMSQRICSTGAFRIMSNNFTNNNLGGIFASQVSLVSPRNGNITQNIINNNGAGAAPGQGFGVSLAAGTQNIKVYMNDFINNNGQGDGLVQAADFNVAIQNSWDNALLGTYKNRGNYYANLLGQVDLNNDGIADPPGYLIAGAFSSFDNFPLMNSFIYYNISEIMVDLSYNPATPGWGATRFNSIQMGYNAVAPGGDVYIANGTYNENLVIANKSAFIYGESKDGVIIDASGSGTVISIINASDVYLTQMTIRNDSINEYGILINNSEYIWVEHTNITDNFVGIFVQNSNYTRINNNTIMNNYDIYAMRTIGGHTMEIDNNTFYGSLETQDTEGLNMKGNIFLNNSGWILLIYGGLYGFDYQSYNIDNDNLANGKPIYFIRDSVGINNVQEGIYDVGQLILVNVNNSIFSSVILSNVPVAVMVYNSNNLNFTDIEVSNTGNGLLFIECSDIAIDYCNIHDNSQDGMFFVNTADTNIYSNEINNNNQSGVYMDAGCNNIELFQNNFENNSFGLQVADNYGQTCFDIALYFNNFTNNLAYGVYINGNNSEVALNNFFNNGNNQGYDQNITYGNQWYMNDTALEGNYWDDYTTRYPAAGNSSGVWDTPYALDGGSGVSDPYPLVWEAEYYNRFNVYVDLNFDENTPGWNITRFNNTQDAIDAAWSDNFDVGTVHIADGTYLENLYINKSISIQGESMSGTRIFSKNQTLTTILIENVNDTNAITLRDLSIGNATQFIWEQQIFPASIEVYESANINFYDLNITESIFGVVFENCTGIHIEDCYLYSWGPDALMMINSIGIEVLNNTFPMGNFRIEEDQGKTVEDLTFDGNDLLNGTWVIGGGDKDVLSAYNVPDTNTAYGKPLLFRANLNSITISEEFGELILVNVNNSMIRDNIFTENSTAIWSYYSSFNTYMNNTFVGSANTIFLREGSQNNTIIMNTFRHTTNTRLYDPGNLTYIYVAGGDYNIITLNNFTNGINMTGIKVYTDNNEISYNLFEDLEWGLILEGSSQNNIIHLNNFTNNDKYGVVCNSGFAIPNYIYRNNFIGNYENLSYDTYWNVWYDNAKFEGNYWSNYLARYPTALNVNGIWDLDYDIDGPWFIQDMNPLVYPAGFYDYDNIYVDDDFDNTTLGWGKTRFNTTQAGIDAVNPFGNVYVADGTYLENLMINKPLNLIGESLTGTIIQANSSLPTITIAYINDVTIDPMTIQHYNNTSGYYSILISNANDITLHELIIRNNDVGISIQNSDGVLIDNCTFINCTSWDNQMAGILAQYSYDVSVIDNYFYDSTTLKTQEVHEMNVAGNTFYGGGGWVFFGDTSKENISSYTVPDTNTLDGKPIYYRVNSTSLDISGNIGQLVLANVNSSQIHDITFTDISVGIWLFYSNDNNISKNTFTNDWFSIMVQNSDYNLFSYNNLSDLYVGGMELRDSDNNSIQYNTFDNLTNTFETAALQLNGDSRNNEIYYNIITNNLFIGITLEDSTSNNKIKYNNITDNIGYGVAIKGDDNLIYHNNFINNAVNQSYDDGFGGINWWYSDELDEGNYWDDYKEHYPLAFVRPNGTWSIQYQINGSITVYDMYPLVFPFEYYNYDVIYVDDDYDNATLGWDVNRFNTTQEGINKANPGATVYIADGIYTENIIINKSVHIIGESVNGVKIFAKSTNESVIYIENTNEVTLDPFTVLNSYTTNPFGMPAFAIYIDNSSNIILKDLHVNNSLNGIYIESSIDVLIENCTFTNITGAAMNIRYSNNTEIIDNIVYEAYIYFESTINTLVDGNTLYNSSIVIDSDVVYAQTHNIPDTNTVNGDPVIYRANLEWLTFTGVYGELLLANVNYSTVHHIQIPSYSVIGIQSVGGSHNNFSFNAINDVSYPLWLGMEYNSTVAGNVFSGENAKLIGGQSGKGTGGIMIMSSNNLSIMGNKIQYFGGIEGIGIQTMKTNNSNIYGNIVENCTFGILVSDSSTNNNIFQNMLINNSQYGMVLYSRYYNDIYQNNFYDNGGNQSIDYDSNPLTNNTWYNLALQRGNYWDNYLDRYSGLDAGGYYNIPWEIDNSSDTFHLYDMYPLVNPFNVIPTIEILTPLGDIDTNTEPTITVEAHEYIFSIDKMWFTINGTATKYFFTDNASIDINWATAPAEAWWTLKFYANNTYNYIGESGTVTIHKDTVDPEINDIMYDSQLEWSLDSLIVSANVTDNFNLFNVEIEIYDHTNATRLPWTPMNYVSGNNYTYTQDVTSEDVGQFNYYKIRATDSVGNMYTVTRYFDIVDTINPQVIVQYYDIEADYDTGTIYVNATLWDNYGSHYCPITQIVFYSPNSISKHTGSMTIKTGFVYEYTWDLYSAGLPVDPNEGYYFTITANDQNGNTNNSETRYFNIVDNVYPTVVVTDFTQSRVYGTGNITIEATVNDNHKLQGNVNISIYYPNATLIGIYPMNNPGGSSYIYNWNPGIRPPLDGYYFNISAIDPSGNLNYTESGIFNITDTIKPQVSAITYNYPIEWNSDWLNVSCNVTDNHALRAVNPVEISIYYSNHTVIVDWTSMARIGAANYSYYWNAITYDIGTGYYFIINATDYSGNNFTTTNRTFNIVDSLNPQISAVLYDNQVEWGTGILNISCDVIDLYGLRASNPVEIQIYNPTGTPILTWTPMNNPTGSTYSFNWSVGQNVTGDGYYFNIRAYDVSNNMAENTNNLFNIRDTVNPIVVIDSFDSSCEYNGIIDVYVNVSDNYALKTPVYIVFAHPNGTIIGNYTMNSGSGQYYYNWPSGTNIPDVGYNFTICAQDTSGNWNNTVIQLFDITDTENPTITGEGINPNPVPDTYKPASNITATVNDNYKLNTTNAIIVKIYYPNYTLITTIVMDRIGASNIFNASWFFENYTTGSGYVLQFNATDLVGNFLVKNYTFSIVSGNPPVVTNPQVTPTILEYDYNLTISCNATDTGYVANVTATIYYPHGTVITTINMTKVSASGYVAYWNSSDIPTDFAVNTSYYVIINATDNDAGSSWTANLLFNIIKTPPNILNPIVNDTTLEYAGDILISANVTDYDGVNMVTAYLYYNNNTYIDTIQLIEQIDFIWNETYSNSSLIVENGYYFIINATDMRGYVNSTGKITALTFSIIDSTTPIVMDIVYNNIIEWGVGILNISCNVTDNYKLKSSNPVEIKIYNPWGVEIIAWTPMTNIGGINYSFSYSVTGKNVNSSYYFRIRATDTVPNSLTTTATDFSNGYFNITDTVDPEILGVSYVSVLEWNSDSLEVTCDATDNDHLRGSSAVQYRIEYSNTTLILDWTDMTPIGGDSYSLSWSDIGFDIGLNYTFFIRVFDYSNNSFTTGAYKFNITDTVNPNIALQSYNDPVEWNTGKLQVTCTVTENYGINTTTPVQIRIRYPNTTIIVDWDNMTNIGGITYGYNWSVLGYNISINYDFMIRVYDVSNNYDEKGYYEFDITDTVNPLINEINYIDIIEWGTGLLNVTCNVTDNYGLHLTTPVEIKIFNPTNFTILDWTVMDNPSVNIFNYTWNVSGRAVDNRYYFKIRAKDFSGLLIESTNQYFNITDTVNPQVFAIQHNDTVEWNTGRNVFYCNATDNNQLKGLNPVLISIYHPNGTLIISTPMGKVTGAKYILNWSVAGLTIGINYIFNITAYDASNNAFTSSDEYFNITDTVAPTIGTIITDPTDLQVTFMTGSLSINATITDNRLLRTTYPVNISIYFPNGTLIGTFNMTNVSGNIYNYTWDASGYPQLPNYQFNITAIDDQNNNKTSTIVLFDIIDNEKPNILIDYYTTDVEYKTGTLIVNVSITDNALVNTTNAYLEIWNPSGTLQLNTSFFVFIGGNSYTYSQSVPTVDFYIANNFYFIVYANDIFGNNNNTGNIFFNIIDTTAPTIISNSLVNGTSYAVPPDFNVIFDETVTLEISVNPALGNDTIGSGLVQHIGSVALAHFNSLSEGAFNMTLWFYDGKNNLNSVNFVMYKDTVNPDFQFAPGTNPDGKSFGDDETPVFYIDITELDLASIKYIIPSIGMGLYQVYPAGFASSGLNIYTMAEYTVRISSDHWSKVALDTSIDITIYVFDQAGNNHSVTFQVIRTAAAPATPMDMIIIIIIIIGSVAGLGAVGFVVVKKKKGTEDDTLPQKLRIKAPGAGARPATPTKAVPGAMKDGKVVGEKAHKGKKAGAVEEKGTQPLTSEEQAAVEATESEMGIEKKKHICVVHKGPIKGMMYICPGCDTYYCTKCAQTLKAGGEKCWACEAEIDIAITKEAVESAEAAEAEAEEEAPTADDSRGILASFSRYGADFKKAMEKEKAFKSVAEFEDMEFNLIDPEILDYLDDLELDLDVKREILQDLMGLTPYEQELFVASIFFKDDEEQEEEEEDEDSNEDDEQ